MGFFSTYSRNIVVLGMRVGRRMRGVVVEIPASRVCFGDHLFLFSGGF